MSHAKPKKIWCSLTGGCGDLGRWEKTQRIILTRKLGFQWWDKTRDLEISRCGLLKRTLYETDEPQVWKQTARATKQINYTPRGKYNNNENTKYKITTVTPIDGPSSESKMDLPPKVSAVQQIGLYRGHSHLILLEVKQGWLIVRQSHKC